MKQHCAVTSTRPVSSHSDRMLPGKISRRLRAGLFLGCCVLLPGLLLAGRVDTPVADASLFSHETHDIYLVTRLDGFSVEDVLALIDRG